MLRLSRLCRIKYSPSRKGVHRTDSSSFATELLHTEQNTDIIDELPIEKNTVSVDALLLKDQHSYDPKFVTILGQCAQLGPNRAGIVLRRIVDECSRDGILPAFQPYMDQTSIQVHNGVVYPETVLAKLIFICSNDLAVFTPDLSLALLGYCLQTYPSVPHGLTQYLVHNSLRGINEFTLADIDTAVTVLSQLEESEAVLLFKKALRDICKEKLVNATLFELCEKDLSESVYLDELGPAGLLRLMELMVDDQSQMRILTTKLTSALLLIKVKLMEYTSQTSQPGQYNELDTKLLTLQEAVTLIKIYHHWLKIPREEGLLKGYAIWLKNTAPEHFQFNAIATNTMNKGREREMSNSRTIVVHSKLLNSIVFNLRYAANTVVSANLDQETYKQREAVLNCPEFSEAYRYLLLSNIRHSTRLVDLRGVWHAELKQATDIIRRGGSSTQMWNQEKNIQRVVSVDYSRIKEQVKQACLAKGISANFDDGVASLEALTYVQDVPFRKVPEVLDNISFD